jgi:hypothetical protein
VWILYLRSVGEGWGENMGGDMDCKPGVSAADSSTPCDIDVGGGMIRGRSVDLTTRTVL